LRVRSPLPCAPPYRTASASERLRKQFGRRLEFNAPIGLFLQLDQNELKRLVPHILP